MRKELGALIWNIKTEIKQETTSSLGTRVDEIFNKVDYKIEEMNDNTYKSLKCLEVIMLKSDNKKNIQNLEGKIEDCEIKIRNFREKIENQKIGSNNAIFEDLEEIKDRENINKLINVENDVRALKRDINELMENKKKITKKMKEEDKKENNKFKELEGDLRSKMHDFHKVIRSEIDEISCNMNIIKNQDINENLYINTWTDPPYLEEIKEAKELKFSDHNFDFLKPAEEKESFLAPGKFMYDSPAKNLRNQKEDQKIKSKKVEKIQYKSKKESKNFIMDQDKRFDFMQPKENQEKSNKERPFRVERKVPDDKVKTFVVMKLR